MWKAAQHLGFDGGLTFELSAGAGNFIGLVPESVAGRTRFIAIERDSLTARIARLLYPQETVLNARTQEVPIPDGEAVLNIGNPPFGSESLLWQYKPEYKGASIHNQFFLAAVDALQPGGLHIAVVSHYLLDAQDPGVREQLAQKARLCRERYGDLIFAPALTVGAMPAPGELHGCAQGSPEGCNEHLGRRVDRIDWRSAR
jgi:hypothetical protein